MTTTSELRSKLESQGEEITHIAHKIEDRLESYIDWPGIVRQHPFQSIGVAAAVGLIFSGSSSSVFRGVGQQVGGLVQAGVTAAIMSTFNKVNSSEAI
jgi:hypothetical protein